ncbi:cell surface protein [Bifidobacterium longum]|uniref:Cell surface protein n=1 Tax=Bifidobacterium longum TaxID=216816 RepID=A0AAW4NKT2_BIFLN|nr:FctA domain-containing protein [Bifidobacterium longum]MBU9885727.1 cell surface protein [Bifidobacterium longum]MBV3439345.1 cell surface protein [Bifidobacterium longum]MBV3496105.1 cell surface protein [Bifidobacterium longum]MBV3533473.1 cell surface protein [Bifidobacterium longum]MBV3535536.1 cell surface protein [Bifidobacterium longum]
MKPGLRKVAALILASATLFGSGASAVSAAYADDTTMGTSIQAEPDVKTTTGDEAGTGADEQSGTGAPAQSAPQADAGQAAPDVTVHDMLDTDSATVSRLRLIDRITGTAPFDADNARGDDKDETNDIVRSYDTVTYDYEYTLTPDSTMDYYRRTRVGFRFELPYPKDKVTFDAEKMGWVDHTPGYEPKLTTETIDGTVTQVYTCYRLLEPTSQSPTVNPGTGSIGLSVAVKGAPHGYRFHPTVKAWPAWDASNPTNTGTHKRAEDTPADVTVSAKLNLNVSLKAYTVGGGVYDFGTGDASAPNKTQGKVSGRQLHVGAMVSMRWPDRSKGLKGIEAPRGRISYKLHVKNVFRDDDADHTKHAGERKWQPLLWDRLHDGYSSSHVRAVDSFDHSMWWFPFSITAGAVNENSVLDGDVSYDEGTTDDDGTTIEVSFDGYDVANYPCRNTWGDKGVCSTDYMDSTGTVQQVAPLHVDNFVFILPTTRDGKTAAQYYGKGQTGIVSAYDYSLTADTESGYSLPSSKDNGNQTVTNDDSTTFDYAVLLPGEFNQSLYYTSCASTDCGRQEASTTGRWQDPERKQGSDRVLAGKSIGIMSSTENNLGTVGDGRVIGYHLMKWDPTVMTPLAAENNPSKPYMVKITARTWGARWSGSDTIDGNSSAPVIWGVRPDGGNFPDDKSQAKASYEDFDWYDTYAEASKHGLVLAATVCDTRVWDSTRITLGQRVASGLTLPVRIKDTAVGRTAQITGQVDFWTRAKLAKANGLDANSDDIAPWVSFVSKVGRLRYRDFVGKYGNANLHVDGKNYVKATFSEDGSYQGGDTAGNVRGDTLYVVGEQPHVGKSTAQSGDDGTSAKTIYDLDKEQRYVDWVVTASAETQASSTGGGYVTDYHIKDTLPAGLTYVDGSSYVGGTYAEHDHGQQRGTVTGGQSITPKISRNKDGTTTLEYVVNGAKADSSTKTRLHFTTMIGDASDPDNDAKNNQQYTNHVEIRSKRAMGEPRSMLGQTADYTIRVSRTRATALATRADPLLNDIERPLGYRNMLGNFSKDEKTNPYAVDIMPYNKGLNQSNYHGDYALAGLTVKAGAGASMNGVKVYFTTDQKWRNADATKITREQVQQWTEATVNATTGKVTIPDGYSKPVAWAFTSPSLPANARYDFILSIKPTGNSAADSYVNRWADGDNKVDAVTQVVERKVNGVAWFDLDHDGVREDTDRLLPDVNVTLVDGNGRTVTSVNGKPCTTTTDRNGHYEIGSIPAGSGFKLRFTPKTGTAWHGQNVTVKNAKEASEATDSDSDQENDSHGDMVAGVITLKPFPALDEMTSAVYEDPNEDHGMSGTLMLATPATFKAVKVLDGRPNGAWTDRDRYVADITALDGAPANAVPASITFADNRTQTLQINSSAFAKEGVYRYQVRERRGDNPGIAYDDRTWVLTVTVQDDLTTFTRRITANTACDGVQSDAIQFTNTYAPKDTQARITASKLFTDADRSATKITDFQFDLYANDKATGTPIQTVNATADGRVEFAPLLFTKARLNGRDRAVFRYSVRERDTGAPGVGYDTHVAVWTVTVTDDNSGQLRATVDTPAGTGARFVNSYSSRPASVTPLARKTLDNPSGTLRLLDAGEFTFELQDADGRRLQSKTNDADGLVRFDRLDYTTVGEHEYRIVEKPGGLAGIKYDRTVHVMRVNVTDDGHGRLNAAVTYDNTPDAPVFRNTYQPKDVTVDLTARKTFDNADASHAKLTDFQFQLFDNERAVGVPVQTVNAAEDGTIRFQPLTFTASQLKGNKSKTFTYTVREIRQSAGGVNYDSHMGLWQITVTDDLTGRLKAQTRTNAAYPTTFTNTYQAKPVSVQFRSHKTLNDPDHTGIQLQAGQYEFTCVEDKTGGQAGTVKTNDQRGDVLFDAISYKKTGVYDYTLSEVHGDKGGVTYDATKHHVKVTVTDNGEGQLLADVKYDNGTNIPEFTNTYHAQPATDNPTAVKKMTASKGNKYTLKGEDFAFTLHQQSAPANVSNADQTKRNDQQGNIRFDQLSFPLVGTYVFTMSEQDTTVPGVTKDGTVATISYVVKDVDHTGKLTVVSKTVTPTTGSNGKNITFTNHYSPKNVGYSISGVKNIVNTDTATSRVPQDGEFKFQLNAVSAHDSDGNAISVNDMPMPAGSQGGTQTVSNKGSGFAFGQMVYTMPGAYTYHVKELAGTDKTIGYSTQEYDVTVTVTDQDGMLAATADLQTNDIRFDNTYTPTPVSVRLEAAKHLTGRDLNDGEFAAELKDSDGNLLQTKRFARVPRDAQSDKATDVREGEGTLEFDKLTFDKTGVYTYTVDEQDGTLGGVTYDTTSHTVTITVTEDAKSHKLAASVSHSNGKASEKSILFRNTYQPEDVLVELSAKKNLTGRELQADEFEFELVDDKGNVIDTERNDKQGNIQFKPLTYGRDNDGVDDCGEHRYVIREKNTGEKNVTYDRTEHHVTVTVSDDLQGNLTAKVEYDPTDDSEKDSNAMLATPTDKADKTKGDAIGDNPSTTPGMVTTTGTRPEFNNSYIPPVTPAIVKTIRQLAKTGVSAPIVALAAFTLLGVGLMLFRRRGNQTETARHRK